MGVMRRTFITVAAIIIIGTAAVHAESWRIALGGGRITGYMGLLASNGLPRTILSDEELADRKRLAEFDVVIVTAPVRNANAVSRAIADFVADGGYAITEVQALPPRGVVSGRRIGPKRSPNIVFDDVDHPIAKAMRGRGLVLTRAWPAIAIIPSEEDPVTRLATFTDERVPDKYRGELTGGSKDMPAVLLIEHGKGQWLYSGAPIAISLALVGPQAEPAILAALEHFSHGELVPRLSAKQPSQRLLPTVQFEPEPEPIAVPRTPRDEEPAGLPEGFEGLDTAEEAPRDFVLVGTLPPHATGRMLLPWYNAQWYRELRIEGGQAKLLEVINGREQVLSVAALPRNRERQEVVVRHRANSVEVAADGRTVLLQALEPMAGEIAASGFEDPFLQPCAPVSFADDFMRTGNGGGWETLDGSWKVFQVEGEADQGANPFAYRAQAGDRATAVAGYWFWDDYECRVAVEPHARMAAILGHWQGPDDHVALRLRLPEEGQATLELTVTEAGETQVLDSRPVAAAAGQWHELRLRLSRGHASCGFNGQEVMQVSDESLRGRGRIGLQIAEGHAFFDDVRVSHWNATPLPLGDSGGWLAERGEVTVKGDRVILRPAGEARAISAAGGFTDFRASALLRAGDAQTAAMLLRYRGRGEYLAIELTRRNGKTLRIVQRDGRDEHVLAETSLNGSSDRQREIVATATGRVVRVLVDGRPTLEAGVDRVTSGAFGLACSGGEASFANVTCWPIERERDRVDPPTPEYAGIIDKHTWAGAGSGWQPMPEDLDTFWHRGLYVGDVEIRLGVHRAADGAACASLMVGDGESVDGGYRVEADQPSITKPVTVRLLRAGDEVASAETSAWGSEGYVLSLERVGATIAASVNGETVCTFRDDYPPAQLDRVGFRRDDAVVDAADMVVLSPAVRTYTFERAPVEWRAHSGQWEIANRWSCSPEWTWLAGWNQTGPAMIENTWRIVGRQQIDVYVAARMMPKPDGKGHYEELRDLHFGICADGDNGYEIVLGGNDNRVSGIVRNGETVLRDELYRLPQAERHNNWLLVTIVKDGATVSVRVWDREVLSYTDDDPLTGGRVRLGTENNGIIVPRVTIWGVREHGETTRSQ